MKGALAGTVILDLTRALAGPYGTMILGDLGATVIKVEPPGGDLTRGAANDTQGSSQALYQYKGESGYFLAINRNKKSIVLDLTISQGLTIFYELVRKADVVYENFRPGVTERLRIDYDSLKGINPKIVYCSITGYGPSGPYKDRPSFDLVAQAMGGGMSITGEPGRAPVRAGIPIGDLAAGMFASHGVIAALYEREKTGEGQKVETSLLTGQVGLLTYIASYYFLSGMVPQPIGSSHQSNVPYQAFKAKDIYLVVAAAGEKFWRILCQILEVPQLIEDPRFKTNLDRIRNKDELIPVLEERFLTKTAEEWLELLNKEGVPAGPVLTVDKVFSDPQVISQKMIIDLKHSLDGGIKVAGNPIKMLHGLPEEEYKYPPTLGQHTSQILQEYLGYSNDKIETLRMEKVVG